MTSNYLLSDTEELFKVCDFSDNNIFRTWYLPTVGLRRASSTPTNWVVTWKGWKGSAFEGQGMGRNIQRTKTAELLTTLTYQELSVLGTILHKTLYTMFLYILWSLVLGIGTSIVQPKQLWSKRKRPLKMYKMALHSDQPERKNSGTGWASSVYNLP